MRRRNKATPQGHRPPPPATRSASTSNASQEETPAPAPAKSKHEVRKNGSAKGTEKDAPSIDDLLRSIDYFHSPMEETEIHFELSLLLHLIVHLMVQNWNIYRTSFYNYNLYLLFLSVIYLSKRVIIKYYYLLRVEYPMELEKSQWCLNFMILTFLVVNALYLLVQLCIRQSLWSLMFLFYPIFAYQIIYVLKGRYSRNSHADNLVWKLLEAVLCAADSAYYAAFLPMMFLQYDYMYYDTTRCWFLVLSVFANSFLVFFSQLAYSNQVDVCIRARSLGYWSKISPTDEQRKAAEVWEDWKTYEEGQVVEYRGRHYMTKVGSTDADPSNLFQNTLLATLSSPSRTSLGALLFQWLFVAALLVVFFYTTQWITYGVVLLFNFHLLYVCLSWRKDTLLMP